jgi:hypothetical protein
MQETAHQATQELTHRPSRVQVECHEATDADSTDANSTDAGSERQPSQRFHLEPAYILAWRAHVRKYGHSKQKCRSGAPSAPTNVEDLIRELETRLTLSDEESSSDRDISFAGVGRDFALRCLAERNVDFVDDVRDLTSAASLLPGLVLCGNSETEQVIGCFVAGCSVGKSYISELLYGRLPRCHLSLSHQD